MPEWLVVVTEYSIILIDTMALLVIVGGTIEAFVRGIGFLFSGRESHLRRDVWHRLATDMKPPKLKATAKEIGLNDLPDAFATLLGGQARGRFVVKLNI